MSTPGTEEVFSNEAPNKRRVKIAPVVTTDEAKVISISGGPGDALDRHKVNENALLLVRKGRVQYSEGEGPIELSEGEGHGIPAEVFHQVTCVTDAEVFVVIPIRGKIKFER
jgi:quercetin dioxygenase-like cupin family protein